MRYGPLHDSRFKITNELSEVVKTGDILFRMGNAKGPLGVPFSKITALLTDSKYSHASIALVEDEIYVMEINENGTLKFRLIDWISDCHKPYLDVYRLKDITGLERENIRFEMQKMLKSDPDYDFRFSDANKYYCTEAVAGI